MDYTKDIYQRKKYETASSNFFKGWMTIQLVITLLFTIHFFMSFGDLSNRDILGYGLFIFIQVFSYTSLMDGSILGIIGECVKVAGVSWVFIQYGSWFGLTPGDIFENRVLVFYFATSLVLSFYFYGAENPKEDRGRFFISQAV